MMQHRPFVPLTRQLEVIRAELPKGASVAHVIALLHIFDICGDSGIKAKDIELLTGESAPTVSRILKAFNEVYDLIDYQQFSHLGPKLIFLTPKGEAMKQRVFAAKDDVNRTAQLQENIVTENISNRIYREQAAERKEIQKQYEAQNRGPLGQIKSATQQMGSLINRHNAESLHREAVADAITYHTGDKLKSLIFSLKAGQNKYVYDQIIRARRKAVSMGSNAFEWRGHMIEVFEPKYGKNLADKKELNRVLTFGVWFYYNIDEDPETHLPVAVQRDFIPREFDKFVAFAIEDLEAAFLITDGGEDMFSNIMNETKLLLNSTQYNKARDLITHAVANVANNAEKAKIVSDMEVEEAEHKAKALHSFANSPTIPVGERNQFRYDAYAADRQAAEAREENENLTKALEEQKEKLDKLYKLVGHLMEDKNDKDS